MRYVHIWDKKSGNGEGKGGNGRGRGWVWEELGMVGGRG